MDGTLTRPQFDFDAIRREIGLKDEPILEALVRMDPEERRRAEAILNKYEAQFAASSELQPGAEAIVSAIRRAGIAQVLMTRNSRESTAVFLERHRLTFDLVWTRADGPMKPSPEPVLEICRRLDVAPAQAWVIGDYLYDIQCGRGAGAHTVLLLNNGKRPRWADEAEHVIESLDALAAILRIEHA